MQYLAWTQASKSVHIFCFCMVSKPHSVHTKNLDRMANSSNTEISAFAPISIPHVQSHTAPHIAENAVAPPSIPNIHSHIAPKLQLDEQSCID